MKKQSTQKSLKIKFGLKRSAISLVLILIATSSLILGTLLQWSVTENKVNKRNFLRIDGKNAGETLVNFGLLELINRWQNTTTPNNSSLSVPQKFLDFYGGSNIILDSVVKLILPIR